jgi:hypothetical protein
VPVISRPTSAGLTSASAARELAREGPNVLPATQPLAQLLGGAWPSLLGLLGAVATAVAVILADGAVKVVVRSRTG